MTTHRRPRRRDRPRPLHVVLVVALLLPTGTAHAAPGSGAPAPQSAAAPTPGTAVVLGPETGEGTVDGLVTAPAADGRWSWPLDGEPSVVRPFIAPAQRWSPGHRGVDLAATAGAVVRSPAAGRVVLAQRVVDRGVVVLEHADGLRTTLEPVEGAPPVGTAVARGDVVGRLAVEGAHCPGCLHWGVRRGTGRTAVYLDPLSFLGPPAPPVLLPLVPWLQTW